MNKIPMILRETANPDAAPASASATSSEPSATPSQNSSEPAKVETPAEPVKVEEPSAVTQAVTPPAEPIVPAEPAAAPAEVEEFELELAEGSSLSEEDFNSIVDEVEKLGLSKDEAEKLISSREALVKKGAASVEAKLKEYNESQRAELFAAPEFKDEATRKQSFESIAIAIDSFGSKELVEFLSTSAGNNVHLARFMKQIGDKIKPEGAPPGSGKSITGSEQYDGLKNMYPEHYEK